MTILNKTRQQIDATEEDIVREEIDCCYALGCIYTETADFDRSLASFQKGWDLSNNLSPTTEMSNNSHAWQVEEMRHALCGGIANSLNGLGRNEESEKKF